MQRGLFETADVPSGFEYRPDFLTLEDERGILGLLTRIEFSKVEMRGAVARRRTAHYGWTYGYDARRSEPGEPIPDFLLPVRDRVAEWAGVRAEEFAEALITDYPEGAPIGWHRDAPMFGDVAGISLGAACRMKFRPYVSPAKLQAGVTRRTTHEIELAPRSAYLIRGIARREYEHSIPPVTGRRYSITFRTLAAGTPGRRSFRRR